MAGTGGSRYPADGPVSESLRRLMKMWQFMRPNGKQGVFSEAVKTRLMPDLYGNPNLTEEEFQKRRYGRYLALTRSVA